MKAIANLSVLIIEDNLGDFTLIKDYLEEQIERIEVSHAKNYAEAIIILNNNDLQLDVVLLDLTLPDKRGESLIKDVVSCCPEIPVIILTGFADVEFSIKSLALKATDYLLKDDITPTSLYKSIKYNIERKKTSHALEESEKRYSTLFQLSPQPMWIINLETLHFLQVNNAAILQYKFSEEEFLQMKLTDIFVDKSYAADTAILHKQIDDKKKIYKGRHKHLNKSGEILEVDIYSSNITINDVACESTIAIDVTEKVRLEHKITKAIIKTQEDERYEIGTELHDNVCQILASSQLSLEMLKDNVPNESIQWFHKSKEFINLALEEIRSISHRLAPSFFDYTTIEDTFKELLGTFNLENKYIIEVNIDFTKLKDQKNSDIQLNLFRILQEQLRNISKYANAKNVKLNISIDDSNCIMQISDDGIGFDYNAVKMGIGLANIRRRTELFSGKMELITSPGNGCQLKVSLPMTTI